MNGRIHIIVLSLKDHRSWLFLTGQNSADAAAAAADDDDDDDDDDDEVKFIGMIVGSVVGGLMCLIVLTAVIIFCFFRFVYLQLSVNDFLCQAGYVSPGVCLSVSLFVC